MVAIESINSTILLGSIRLRLISIKFWLKLGDDEIAFLGGELNWLMQGFSTFCYLRTPKSNNLQKLYPLNTYFIKIVPLDITFQ